MVQGQPGAKKLEILSEKLLNPKRTGGTQVVEHLPGENEALSSKKEKKKKIYSLKQTLYIIQ
jgi:hypothetical protein